MSAQERKDVQGDENGLSTGKTSPYTTKTDACHHPHSAERTHTCLMLALLRKGKHGHDEKAGDTYLSWHHLPRQAMPTVVDGYLT